MAEELEMKLWPMAEQGRQQMPCSDWRVAAWCGRGAPRPRVREGGGPEAQGAAGRRGRAWGRWEGAPLVWGLELRQTDWVAVAQTPRYKNRTPRTSVNSKKETKNKNSMDNLIY